MSLVEINIEKLGPYLNIKNSTVIKYLRKRTGFRQVLANLPVDAFRFRFLKRDDLPVTLHYNPNCQHKMAERRDYAISGWYYVNITRRRQGSTVVVARTKWGIEYLAEKNDAVIENGRLIRLVSGK
jgi:hypothetical protein